jgi:hypothetical protein
MTTSFPKGDSASDTSGQLGILSRLDRMACRNEAKGKLAGR